MIRRDAALSWIAFHFFFLAKSLATFFGMGSLIPDLPTPLGAGAALPRGP